jgi:hypothetical protein
LLSLLGIQYSGTSFAQQPFYSAALYQGVPADTIIKADDSITHSPRKAAILSAIVPGAGQFYNKRFWKIPVIYAGLGAFAYFAKTQRDSFRHYYRAYDYRTDGNPATIDPYVTKYADESLKDIRDFYRKNRDLCIIGFTAFYLLNIIDANVDAHLFRFRIDKDLAVQLQPDLRRYDDRMRPYLTLRMNF